MKFIEHKNRIKVRFSETDAMGVIWHGNYLKYFEDGRESMGEALGMTYFDLYNLGFVIPLVKMHLEYKFPVHFGEEVEVTTRLEYCKAAKIKYTYQIHSVRTGKLCCEGWSEQVFVEDKSRSLALFAPNEYVEWYNSLNWVEA